MFICRCHPEKFYSQSLPVRVDSSGHDSSRPTKHRSLCGCYQIPLKTTRHSNLFHCRQDSSFGIENRLWPGSPWTRFRFLAGQVQGNFPFSKTYRSALRLTQTAIQLIKGKRPVCEVDQSPISIAEVNNDESVSLLSHYLHYIHTGNFKSLQKRSLFMSERA